MEHLTNSSLPQVVIFCGGRGMRFREETEFRPKPLITLGERPILWHIMKIFAKDGFTRFVLPLGYKGEMITDHFKERDPETTSWDINTLDTGLEVQTGARLFKAKALIDSEYFFVTYGDGVADINPAEILAYHKTHGKIGTITGVHPIPRFGELTLDGGRVSAFREKPKSSDIYMNGGFMVFDHRIFNYLHNDDSLAFEVALEKMARDGELMVFKHEKFWQPMDTYRDWEDLTKLLSAGRAPWKTWD